MKFKLRFLSLLLAALLLLPMLPFGTFSADAATGTETETETTYTKNKVVTVLFDNSGSMISPSRLRWDYAKYALQTLMATLGKNDTLVIQPMHGDAVEVTLNTDKKDRDKEIKRVMTETDLFKKDPPSGNGTPGDSVEKAVQQLVSLGMKKTTGISADENSTNEYFLVVLTDGKFQNVMIDGKRQDCKTASDTATLFVEDLSRYAFFQSIYIGFTKDAFDLSTVSELQKKANFFSRVAKEVTNIGQVMGEVANRITGRYPLEIPVDKTKSTVDISLPTGFAVRNVTVMATNTDAIFKSAAYNGKAIKPSHDANFYFKFSGKGGFTTIFTQAGDAPFSGGKLSFAFDKAPGADATISILLEPALMLEPVIEADTDDGRIQIDSAYINSQMKTGDDVYPGYRIVEQKTGRVVDPKALGGVHKEIVTYNGEDHDLGKAMALVEGKHEIAISVSLMKGKYSLYTAFPCVVLNDPDSFRVEYTKIDVKDHTTFDTTFTVYNDSSPIASSEALADFELSALLMAEDGKTGTTLSSLRKNSDGTFTVTLDTKDKEYGTYTIRAEVRDNDGNLRTADVPIGYYPEGLAITSTGSDSISKTLYGILENNEGFGFALTAGKDADKIDIPFENPLLEYTFTVGGVDMTEIAEVNGNTISFLPNPETLGELASKTGEYDVVLRVTFNGATVETVEYKTKLVISETIFEVVPLAPTGTVDRFALRKNTSTVSFKVLRDGVPLPLEELQAALDDGTLYLDHGSYRSFLSPVRADVTLSSVGDVAVLTVLPRAGQFFLLRGLVTSMLVFGDTLHFDVHYGDVNGVGAVPLADADLFAYIWRILLILYIIQLIVLALTFSKVKRIPQGVFVRVPILSYDQEESELKGKVIVIKRLGLREYLVLKRLLPFVGLCFWTKNISTTEGILKYHLNAGVCITAGIKCMEGELKPNGLIVSSTLKNKGWSALRPGTSFNLNKITLSGARVKITQKTSKASIDQPLSGTRGLILKNKFYLFVSARSVGKK